MNNEEKIKLLAMYTQQRCLYGKDDQEILNKFVQYS